MKKIKKLGACAVLVALSTLVTTPATSSVQKICLNELVCINVVEDPQTKDFLKIFSMFCDMDKEMHGYPDDLPLSQKSANKMKKMVYFCQKM